MSTRLQLPGVSNTPQVFPSGFNRIRNSILCILRWMKKTHCNTVNTPDFEHPSGQGRRIHRSEIICFSMWTAWWIPLILDSPKWTYQLPEKMKNPRKRSVFKGLWWSQQDSNLWPHRCERCALRTSYKVSNPSWLSSNRRKALLYGRFRIFLFSDTCLQISCSLSSFWIWRQYSLVYSFDLNTVFIVIEYLHFFRKLPFFVQPEHHQCS